MRESVVITGAGVVTPIGVGLADFERALRESRSGGRPIASFACEGFPTRIAATVDDSTYDPTDYVEPRKAVKLMSRATVMGVAAAAQAARNAGLCHDSADPDRVGVSVGVGGMGPVDLDLIMSQAAAILDGARENNNYEMDLPGFARAYRAKVNPLSILRGLPNLVAAHIAIQRNARGPNNTLATACSAGTQAIGEGMKVIERGDADVMFAGGADAMINPIGVLGFSLLGTLSVRNDSPATASRPFDRDRDGFVIGEGAGIVVLERESHARARGAPVMATLAGYGVTSDAYRITDERPDAVGAAKAMQHCLRDAGVSAGDVGYINAHGTGTQMNDVTETRAIREVFGAQAYHVPVSSTKSQIGHTLAAAGAIELIAALVALGGGFLPATINYSNPDPSCDLDYVPNVVRPARFDAALSNSFGFGGQNACLLIRHA